MLKPCEPSRSLARVLVTGGAGFVGSHIVDLLVARGCREVVVVDNLVRGRTENLSGAMASGAVELVIGDIRDRDLMAGLVAGCDTVFHQAALRITHDNRASAAEMLGLSRQGFYAKMRRYGLGDLDGSEEADEDGG